MTNSQLEIQFVVDMKGEKVVLILFMELKFLQEDFVL